MALPAGHRNFSDRRCSSSYCESPDGRTFALPAAPGISLTGSIRSPIASTAPSGDHGQFPVAPERAAIVARVTGSLRSPDAGSRTLSQRTSPPPSRSRSATIQGLRRVVKKPRPSRKPFSSQVARSPRFPISPVCGSAGRDHNMASGVGPRGGGKAPSRALRSSASSTRSAAAALARTCSGRAALGIVKT